jgi:hypothetical protein
MPEGTTMFPNINERLSREVTGLAPNSMKAKALGPSEQILSLIHLYLVKLDCSLAFVVCFFEIEDVWF